MTHRHRGSIPRDMQDQQASGDRKGAPPKTGKKAGDRRGAGAAPTKDVDTEKSRRPDDATDKATPPTSEPPD
ncbi:hypothetical protein [Streptomyces cinnamoneus]|uniref:Uncharacterized protein n=1 Tax=Streptomyces cinnamoneus TaxID=53446 RepID=A0A918WF07_STRCJ|nr:hypothetical protein [Streptomyces cinnamoneus]GHC39524.1 hypothetical protein GCM10010507_11680 [Streptomyces cinnamoneus]